jgi:type IV pilus assembly protein PilA
MKKTNKGFSLVELIIVIAIMAILAGAIAPALIKYIDKSRKSNDVSSAKTIKTAVETALGTEYVYEYMTNTAGSIVTINQAEDCSTLSSYTGISSAISVNALDTSKEVKTSNGDVVSADNVATVIGANIGAKTPKIKYKKTTGDVTPDIFYVTVSPKGVVAVGVAGTAPTSIPDDGSAPSGCIELTPNLSEDYQ